LAPGTRATGPYRSLSFIWNPREPYRWITLAASPADANMLPSMSTRAVGQPCRPLALGEAAGRRERRGGSGTRVADLGKARYAVAAEWPPLRTARQVRVHHMVAVGGTSWRGRSVNIPWQACCFSCLCNPWRQLAQLHASSRRCQHNAAVPTGVHPATIARESGPRGTRGCQVAADGRHTLSSHRHRAGAHRHMYLPMLRAGSHGILSARLVGTAV